jgi:hypothetical protein
VLTKSSVVICSMRALYLLALVSLAVFGLSVAVDYQPIAAYCEGTALNIWSFGASTAASRTIGTAYTPAVIYPGTNTTGADAEVGEIHVLKCAGGTNCPDVFDRTTSSLWTTRVSLLWHWRKTDDNTTYNSMAKMDTEHYVNSSGGAYEYRFIAAEGDKIFTGTTSASSAKRGNYGGSPIFYFGFGFDSYGTVENAVYIIAGGPVILANGNSHMVKRYTINPPSGADVSEFRRLSDIPAEWLSDSGITSTDNVLYEYGFFPTTPTAPPVAAASGLVPSVIAILFAVVLALIF